MQNNSARPATQLCRHTNDAIYIRDASLVDDLIGRLSFTEMFFFHLMARRPTAAETALLDAVLVTLMEHGLTPSAIAARMVALSSPEATQAAIAAGLLAVGSQFIGTIEDSARLLIEIAAAPDGVEAAAAGTVARFRTDKKLLPGFGHHLHRPDDPRTPRLLELAREHGFAGRYVNALLVLAAAVDKAANRHITINATGAVGAILAELGVPLSAIRGIAVVSRAAGLVGHVQEELTEPVGRFIWDLAEHEVEHRAGPAQP